ncbi:MAG: L-threonylcarbamoyladenylate synthase [Bacteroidales bacterium]
MDKGFEEDIKNCIKVLRSGGVILYPTDTVWGLGCDPSNAEAVEKIFRIKERNESKSLIMLANGLDMVERYTRDIPSAALEILSASDKPVTIIFPSAKNIAPAMMAEDGSVGIRITDDPFCLQLIERFRKPLVSTSANISGEPAPSHFGEISGTILSRVDFVVEYRKEDRRKHKPSPVIKVEQNGVIKIIRM